MNEKISDESFRRAKVLKLKTKILLEIEIMQSLYKIETSQNISDVELEHYINHWFCLLKLKEYINSEDCFMDYACRYNDKDIIIYMVSDDDLNIWLQDDYPFVDIFLEKARENNYDVFSILNDKYFGYQFTNICDKALYKRRRKEL